MLLNSLKISVLITFLTLSSSIFSSAYSDDNVDPLIGLQISPAEILKSLEQMKATGQISAEDFEKAKRHVANMSSLEVKALNQTAIGMVRNNPDKAVELTKGKTIDTQAVQKQINALSKPAD